MPHQPSVTLSIADAQDRQSIYALRHQVYARELRQHLENREGLLTDVLDQVNTYLVAKRGNAVVGFVAITPPNPHGYSVDKYFARRDLPFTFDNRLFEVRLLTVVESDRRTMLATLLMYGALRYVESQGARVIVAIGRGEILGLYERAGLRSHGLQVQAGSVRYELMSANVRDLRSHLEQFGRLIRRFEHSVEWCLDDVPYRPEDACVHGGAFWRRSATRSRHWRVRTASSALTSLTRGSTRHRASCGRWSDASPLRSRPRRRPAVRECAVVKSMSKAYALSGVRAAYLCAPPRLVAEARRWCPPWAVSLPGQIAACEALRCVDYYRRRWHETGVLRGQLQAGLEAQGWDVVPSCANFLLCHLPLSAPDATRFWNRSTWASSAPASHPAAAPSMRSQAAARLDRRDVPI